MKSIGIDCFKGRIFVQAYAQTTVGLWIGTEAIEVVHNATPHAKLGETSRQVLAQSVSGVPHPTDFSQLGENLMRIAGVKSWNTFAKNSTTCTVTADDECYKIVSYRKQGKQGAKIPMNGAKLILHNPSDEELGQAIQAALKVAAEAEPGY